MGVKLRKNPLRQLNLLEQEKQVFSTKTLGGGGSGICWVHCECSNTSSNMFLPIKQHKNEAFQSGILWVQMIV